MGKQGFSDLFEVDVLTLVVFEDLLRLVFGGWCRLTFVAESRARTVETKKTEHCIDYRKPTGNHHKEADKKNHEKATENLHS